MPISSRTAVLLAAMFASTVGCSSDGGAGVGAGAGAGGGGSATFYASLAAAECERVFACCKAEDLAKRFKSTSPPPTDAASCEKSHSGIGALASLILQDALGKKRLSFDSAQAAKCLAAVKGTTCADFKGQSAFAFGDPWQPAECKTVVVAAVESGGACSQSSECKTGHCTGSSSKDGTCAAPPKEGDACGPDISCGTGGLACSNGKCIKFGSTAKADGEDCTFGSDCTSGSCQAKKCAAKVDKDAACVADSDCKSANCDSKTSKCVDPRKVGDACVSDTECPDGPCTDSRCTEPVPICVGK